MISNYKLVLVSILLFVSQVLLNAVSVHANGKRSIAQDRPSATEDVLFLPLIAAEKQIEEHRLRFFLDPALATDLTSDELGHRLTQYAEDLNTIFAKQTNRRFFFDPAKDIVLTDTQPQTDNAIPPLPEHGYEMWAYAQLSEWFVNENRRSYGGYGSIDESGAGVAAGLYWDAVHNREALVDGSAELEEYWIQIDHITHEFEHIFGAGLGEYYNLMKVEDSTGVEPIQNIDISLTAPYWSQHFDFFGDPLLRIIWNWEIVGSPVSYSDLMEKTRFARLSNAVIDSPYRTGNSCTDPGVTCLGDTIPDLSSTRVRVVDSNTQTPLPNATVCIWKIRTFSPYVNELIAQEKTDQNGEFVFSWTVDFNNYDAASIFKAYLDGYIPQATWKTIFDAQERKMVYGEDEMVIELALMAQPTPPIMTSALDSGNGVCMSRASTTR